MDNGVFRLVRRLLSGEPRDSFVFCESPRREYAGVVGAADLYVHIPYCLNQCAYCPYNTRVYSVDEMPQFFKALRAEMQMLSNAHVTMTGKSLYVGGGTPTCVGEGLFVFLEECVDALGMPSTVAVETRPEELTSAMLQGLRNSGVTQLSVGIQSFNNRILRLLGRTGNIWNNVESLARALDAGFCNVNVDLMFSTEGESVDELLSDLAWAMKSGADQITVYPVFKFSHSKAGQAKGLKGVVMPNLRNRFRYHRAVWRSMTESGYEPVSVWSFKKTKGANSAAIFSSVQRKTFVGLGPGAATSTDERFLFNTFSFEEWQRRVLRGAFAYSLEMRLNPNLRALYDLYWDLYALHCPKTFSSDLKRRWLFAYIRKLLTRFGLIDADEGLTSIGSFWIHLLQNYYALNYIEKVWSISKREPFPKRVEL